MSNALTIYERMSEMQTAASAMHASGMFNDVKTQAQALVKVMAGAEIGLPPFAAMTGIHIVQGKPILGANLIATMVKNDSRYDYRVKRADNQACILAWYEAGHVVGESAFTIEEAVAAGLAGKDNWKKYPSDMLFARALTRGARRYAPGIFGGSPIYTPDELGADTDEDGYIIDVPVASPVVTIPAVTGPGPMSDDDLTVSEASAREFVAVAAGLLSTDEADIKTRLQALGYTGISGKAAERVKAYHALKSSNAMQDDLFDEHEPVVTNGAYSD